MSIRRRGVGLTDGDTVEDEMGKFLTAQWRNLVMANWEVDPALLAPYVPKGTSLDLFEGKAFVSLVAFQFLDTQVLGVPIPWHRNFEEVNLRFYVVREVNGELRRGVVFISEYVPRFWIALVARTVYNERYSSVPMRHQVTTSTAGVDGEYAWRVGGKWHNVRFSSKNQPQPLVLGSREKFIAEHYWGYTVQRNGGTMEYKVEHESWQVWTQAEVVVELDGHTCYGAQFGEALSKPATFSFVAQGSPVVVNKGSKL